MRDQRLSGVLALILTIIVLGVTTTPGVATTFAFRTLDGSGNNLRHPDWGRANTLYLRVAPTNYADGISSMANGPSIRYVSNRVFNDIGQNIFSKDGVTQWGWVWGQFIDHDFGLRDERPAESAPIGFDQADPLEGFTNDLGAIGFARTPAAPGTGVSTPRQQVNTLSSYIDASNVYGVDRNRLEWLRVGPVDGDMSNNGPRLMLTDDGFLPRVGARGDPSTAPAMDLMGPLAGMPNNAVVAGDVRANENIALTSLHTLFAREHNRIVASLPSSLSAEERFQIARRVVGAEIEYITYTQFLPALGVRLDPYHGYDPAVNPGLSNEFAVVGYRAHSMIHGEFDVARGRDHGLPTYNDLRRAYGLAPKTSFVDVTGEATQSFPADPLIDAQDPINDPNILDFVELRDAKGNLVAPGSTQAEEEVVTAVRRTTLAARLKAVYGDVDRLDAFVGMVSERHVKHTEFGELQLAIWTKQFTALRDGDRFFYRNDPVLRVIYQAFGIDYRLTVP